MRILCIFILFLVSVSAASAEIRISVSRYENGRLTVAGTTDPNEAVTLDDKYKTTSDSAGRFAFHLDYKPDLCMTDINAGTDVYSAVIAGCFLPTEVAVPAETDTPSAKPPG